MNLANLKIATRLALLGGLVFLALVAVGLGGWSAISAGNAKNAMALEQAATLSDAIDKSRSAQVGFKDQVQAFKNILMRGGDAAQFKSYTDKFNKAAATTDADLQKTGALLDKLGIKTPLIADTVQAHQEMSGKFLEALQKYDPANADSAHAVDESVRSIDRAPTKKIDDIVAFIQEQSHHVQAGMAEDREAGQRQSAITLFGIVLATLVIGGAAVAWLARSITAPLNAAIGIAQTVADGDLCAVIEVRSSDEIGTLLLALKHMQDSLAEIVGKVRAGTDAIANASREIAQGNQDLSIRTEQQATSLGETASSMGELTGTVKQNGESANQASKLAASASQVAVRGGAAVAQVIDTMGSINASSKKIVDIIGVIDGIAFQTNILALNEAVEAARAGGGQGDQGADQRLGRAGGNRQPPGRTGRQHHGRRGGQRAARDCHHWRDRGGQRRAECRHRPGQHGHRPHGRRDAAERRAGRTGRRCGRRDAAAGRQPRAGGQRFQDQRQLRRRASSSGAGAARAGVQWRCAPCKQRHRTHPGASGRWFRRQGGAQTNG